MAPPLGGLRTSLRVDFKGQMAGYTQGGVFSPGIAIQPVSNEPVRIWDFPVNVNANPRPRAYSPVSFQNLRAFANVEQVRLAIETRKDQLERLSWNIKPIDEKSARKSADEISPRLKAVEAFWKRPDGVRPFRRWFRRSLEDLLVLDAPAFQMLRTRGGGPRGVGKLIGMEVIFGDSIKPMVDDTGRRPTGLADIAYQQYLPGKGVVWTDLRNQDLMYAPRNERPNHEYGYGPVEQIIVTINTIIRRQAAQLAYFTEGNVPAGILNAPEGWQPAQIKEIQEWMDAKLKGLTAEQAKLLWTPAGTKYQAFKEAPLKDDFDEWLARIVAFAFSLPPTPFIRQMNKGTAGEDQERGLEEGLEPLKLWWKEIADAVIQDELGHPDLEWAWNDEAEVDRVQQNEMDDKNLRNGSVVIDEVRDRRGQDPLPDGLGSRAMVYTGTGPVLLEEVIKAFDDPEPEQVIAPAAGTDASQGQSQGKDDSAGNPAPQDAEKLAKAAARNLATVDRPKARRARVALQKAIAPILVRAGDEASAFVAMKLRGLNKAADDTGGFAAIAAKLAKDADLSAMQAIADVSFDDLFEIAADSAELGLASVGVKAEGDLVNQVHDRAVAYARRRGAELVAADGDKNVIEATRASIRDVIARGLADNIGSSAIADNIQASAAFSAERAGLIAQTEIAMANADGKLSGWKAAADTGLTLMKGWQTSNDGDCCDECQANEDQGLIPVDDDFDSGDAAEPAHPNCHCATYAEVAEENDDEAKAAAAEPITQAEPAPIKKTFERTVVTQHDAQGRIVAFERHTVEE